MCKYCNSDSDIIAREKHTCFGEEVIAEIWISIDDKEIYSMLDDITLASAKIKYCPMCGRKLNTD